jgi:hypothetical protein
MENKEVDGLVFSQRNKTGHVVWARWVEGRQIYLHRYLYEKYHNVTLPYNKRVFFKNGDYTDLSKENLTLGQYIPYDKKVVDGHVFHPRDYDGRIHWICNLNRRRIFLGRYLYEKYHNVSLPNNKKVFFKNGDYTDFSRENLVLYPPCEIDTEKGIIKRGDTVPQPNHKGYLLFSYQGKLRAVHRIIYEHHHNVKLTKDQVINHINFDITDNRICNLEIVNSNQSCQWRRRQRNNTTGYKGVSFHTGKDAYQAEIRFRTKSIYLGTYTDPIEAARAYNAKAEELNEKFDGKYTLNPLN